MEPANRPPVRFEDGFFLVLVLVVSVAFALVLEPFFVAVLWGLIAAILFNPLNRRVLAAIPGHRNSAAALTLLLIVAVIIVPAILLTLALVNEASVFYGKVQSGQINFADLFAQVQARLPDWVVHYLERFGLTDFAALQARLDAGLAASFRTIATRAVIIGQGAFSLLVALSVTLYLTYFLLRDGDTLADRVMNMTPLHPAQREALMRQFVTVIRATIKGSIVVAILQGLIGGIVFWLLDVEGALLWGVMMGFFSLLPAIGTGLVWVPVAIYLLATGAIAKGLILVFCGLFVIGMVDNLLRPILVGRDARLPDYVVLISTLGGIELFGFSGIVIGPVIAALFLATWTIVADMRAAASGGLAASAPDSVDRDTRAG
ncbi:MAG: AI-2E family transporter [Sphingobium sp. SCN 64-10]|nr:MAG: AI-2E family transporter [Sphingobium sp. SCN 64-10]